MAIATFSRAELFPDKQPPATLVIADTVDGPVVRSLDGNTGYTSGSEVIASREKRRAAIITDRNLYRPGQIVKIKGIVRDANGTNLTIPTSSEVSWQVAAGDEKRVVKEGTAILSPEGSLGDFMGSAGKGEDRTLPDPLQDWQQMFTPGDGGS